MFLDPFVAFVEQFAQVCLALLELLLQSDAHVFLHFAQPRLRRNSQRTTTNSDHSNSYDSVYVNLCVPPPTVTLTF